MTATESHRIAALIDAAHTTATTELHTKVGPIPLNLRSSPTVRLADFAAPLLGSDPPSWPGLDVTIATSHDMAIERIPASIRPGHDQVTVAHEGTLTALCNGPDGTLWLLDPTAGRAVLWVGDIDALPLWEHTSPLRTALRWWATRQGGAMVHAGLVALGDRGVLLVGDSGAGKSTTTMACHGTGLRVLGDDFCLIDRPSNGLAPTAYGIYRLAKLSDDSLALLPHLVREVTGTAWRGKKLIPLRHEDPTPCEITAICHVVQDPAQPTHLEPMSKIRALRAVAPSTMFQHRLWETETWDALAATVRAVPTFQLSVSATTTIGDVITDHLRSTS